ncbi:MAG: hypothetical protein ACOCZV_00980 [Nanoarchaeota archaeon]
MKQQTTKNDRQRKSFYHDDIRSYHASIRPGLTAVKKGRDKHARTDRKIFGFQHWEFAVLIIELLLICIVLFRFT